MKFSDLEVGAQFRLHHRGTLLTKTGRSTYATALASDQKIAADTTVLTPEGYSSELGPEPAAAANPFGDRNKVDFQHGYVRLDGAFTPEQLEAVLSAMIGPG